LARPERKIRGNAGTISMAGRFHRAGNNCSFWAGGICLALARCLANAKVLGDLTAFAYRDLRFYGVAAAAVVAFQGIVGSRNMKRRLDARLPEAVPMSRKIRPISPAISRVKSHFSYHFSSFPVFLIVSFASDG
jgi:hypothetical protein